ncbi:2'-5' RNA ligase family protein [Georgenia sp. SYP-B2076]|uniref:2'-5' RNA ligase family protein n=1 Tax=Georgenia sp. SYP-B2076 TaxID=2495881 RepID=UPI000F8F31C9|nr:2'-5' RNA ligase family protein [Georgenia sp. SYP-B2076]
MYLPERVGDQVRIGVALQVPAPYATLIQATRARLGDPMAKVVPPHVTLLPPTVVEPDRLGDVAAHLAEVAAGHPAFVMSLEGTGSFRPVSPVVFVKVVQGGDSCAVLEQAVRTGVLAQDLRFPYHPHVTIAHELDDATLDVAEEAMADFRATYAAGSMRLYEHGDDGMWRTIARMPLTGPVPAHR